MDPAIIHCPVCVSTEDVTEPGEQKFECHVCSTVFTVVVDPEVIAAHSHVG